ncbi:MAG: EF-Tu/IF-2/RF-3 family GTPase [Nanoarchaeota archaeon]|nr:EF-Tu/IF-2/RF-3 family GTPase [Nanoarchaeota archaeon]
MDEEENLGEELGKVTHYFTKMGVCVIEITNGSLKVGDKIKIKGATSDFEQDIDSMQIEHEKVEEAKAGQSIGLKVKEHVREHDKVYKV